MKSLEERRCWNRENIQTVRGEAGGRAGGRGGAGGGGGRGGRRGGIVG